ncbi:MAG: family 20 glycosylhydrolase [Bacteroidota bacterium]
MRYFPLFALLFCACTEQESGPNTDLAAAAIVPAPLEIRADSSALSLDQAFRLEYSEETIDSQMVDIISDWLSDAGVPISDDGDRRVWLENRAADATPESYKITIDEEEIRLVGVDPAGLRHAAQTLRQLLLTRSDTVNYLPTGVIRDSPRFAYRGFMLDVSRHFFPPETVERVIDYLAMYKFNHLHLHLSDDQGWRLEIESYPRLTAIGGSTEVGGGPGGFYTQQDYLDLQEYAADRGIIIVPEFDLPGHTNAALASYAELNCDGRARELYTGTEVGFSSLCVSKEYVYEFLDTVLAEVAQLTTGPFIHIGGDEVHTLDQAEYNNFIERVAEMLERGGKRVLGWDEIAQAQLPAGSVAQYWNFAENAQAAVAQGQAVLFSPATNAYLDMKYDSTTELGLSWAGFTDLEDAYSWDPVGMVAGVTEAHIIGVEAPLWSETIESLDDIEYLLFPRIAAISEVAWSERMLGGEDLVGRTSTSTPANPYEESFTFFEQRLLHHYGFWEDMGINFHQ